MRRRALRLKTTRSALAIGTLVGLLLTPSPLLGVHGAESALVLGVVLPPFTAAIGVRLVAAVRRDGAGIPAGPLLGTSAGTALFVLAGPVAVLALNALRVRQCTPLIGLGFIVLGPAIGVVLTAIVGTAIATSCRRAWVATTLAVVVPVSALALALYRFWATPAIAFYGHSFGWFPGTIYDEELALPLELVTFRAVTLALLGGVAFLVASFWDPGATRARILVVRSRKARLIAALLLFSAVGTAEAHGPELGHWTTASYIADSLGTTRDGARCRVHAPRELRRDKLKRLVADCDFRVRQAERVLGVEQDEQVVAFFFRSADEKRRHMGAGRTFIAKPWRNEVYLQRQRWPHPVLAHEIAHVVAGRAASAPWYVSGPWGGWLPNPGIIEGTAVATAWNPRDDLTPHQWAKAMIALDEMPPLERIIGMSFVLESSRHAYTAAGSFVRFLRHRYGPDAVRRTYRTGNVVHAVGESLPRLETRWHAFLENHIEMSPGAFALARVRFEGHRSIFVRVCPRRVANLRERLAEERSAGADQRAERTCRRILDIDPGDRRVRAELVGALARTGDIEAARRELEQLAGPLDAPAPIIVEAREALADAAWLRGDGERARRIYRSLLDRPQPDAEARAREVKALAIEAGGRQAELVRDLLVGRDGRPGSPPLVMHLAHELGQRREDGLGAYLEARQLYHRERFEHALPLLRRARRRGLPTERIAFEAKRLEGIALVATGRYAQAADLWRSVAVAPGMTAGRRSLAKDWLERIAFVRADAARARGLNR